VLPDWNVSCKNIWPRSATSFADAYAETTSAPYHPGSRWGAPEEQARRRAEKEKHHREIGENYQRMTAAQEERINREERARHRG
jgi:hypothetical protein